MYYFASADAQSSRLRTTCKDMAVIKSLSVLAASLLLVSCATPQQIAKTDEVPVQKTYRTGSNLPVRDNEVPNVRSDPANIVNIPAPIYIPNKAGN